MAQAKLEIRIMNALKHELRAKGLHNREIADHLGVSEATIKRYFTGRGVTLTVLGQLAELAGLDLVSLAELAENEPGERTLTTVQLAALGSNLTLSACFFLLRRGWTPGRLASEFQLEEWIETILDKLESLDLIRRLKSGIKVLAAPDFAQGASGWLGETQRENVARFMDEFHANDPMSLWTASVARLSPQSRQTARKLMHAFLDDLNALTQADGALPKDDVQWFRVLIGAQPIAAADVIKPWAGAETNRIPAPLKPPAPRR